MKFGQGIKLEWFSGDCETKWSWSSCASWWVLPHKFHRHWPLSAATTELYGRSEKNVGWCWVPNVTALTPLKVCNFASTAETAQNSGPERSWTMLNYWVNKSSIKWSATESDWVSIEVQHSADILSFCSRVNIDCQALTASCQLFTVHFHSQYSSQHQLVNDNDQWIFEGSLEVKLPTVWTNEKQRWEEAERREEQKREDDRRERVRRKKMQMREKVGKSRNTVFFHGSGGLKSRLA